MKTSLYNESGKSVGEVAIPSALYTVPMNQDLIQQVIVGMQSNARANTAHTKMRGEVAGGGRKPWQQKGTGRARHGSKRSPIWIGGGITFGPRNERNYDKKINKKMKQKALLVMLSEAMNTAKIMFVQSIPEAISKTKDAMNFLVNLSHIEGFKTINTLSNKNNILLIVPEITDNVVQAFRNLPHVWIEEARAVNTLHIAHARYILVVSPDEVHDIIALRTREVTAKKETTAKVNGRETETNQIK